MRNKLEHSFPAAVCEVKP